MLPKQISNSVLGPGNIRSSQVFFSAYQLVKITTKQKHVFSQNVSETPGKSGHNSRSFSYRIISFIEHILITIGWDYL